MSAVYLAPPKHAEAAVRRGDAEGGTPGPWFSGGVWSRRRHGPRGKTGARFPRLGQISGEWAWSSSASIQKGALHRELGDVCSSVRSVGPSGTALRAPGKPPSPDAAARTATSPPQVLGPDSCRSAPSQSWLHATGVCGWTSGMLLDPPQCTGQPCPRGWASPNVHGP